MDLVTIPGGAAVTVDGTGTRSVASGTAPTSGTVSYFDANLDRLSGPTIASFGTVTFSIRIDGDGTGAAVTTGNKGFMLTAPFDFTLTGFSLFGDQIGSISIDLWVQAFASYPPTIGETITGAAKPALTNAIAAQVTDLNGWTSTAVAKGDVFFLNVDNVAVLTWVVLELRGNMT